MVNPKLVNLVENTIFKYEKGFDTFTWFGGGIPKVFDRVTGAVVDVGAGHDLSTIVLFENASSHVMVEEREGTTETALCLLLDNNIITRPNKNMRANGVTKYDFEFTQPSGNQRTVYQVTRDVLEGFPDLEDMLDSKLGALWYRRFPYTWHAFLPLIDLFPALEVGGIIHGIGRSVLLPDEQEIYGFEAVRDHDVTKPTGDEGSGSYFKKTKHIDRDTFLQRVYDRFVAKKLSEYKGRGLTEEQMLQRSAEIEFLPEAGRRVNWFWYIKTLYETGIPDIENSFPRLKSK